MAYRDICLPQEAAVPGPMIPSIDAAWQTMGGAISGEEEGRRAPCLAR